MPALDYRLCLNMAADTADTNASAWLVLIGVAAPPDLVFSTDAAAIF